MPGPEQLIRVAVTLPFTIARTVAGIALGLLPGGHEDDDAPTEADVDIMVAADDAMTREREPIEEAPLLPDDDGAGHVDTEAEVVAESADPEAEDPPGAEIHIDDGLRQSPERFSR
jgi:hypothetical protein